MKTLFCFLFTTIIGLNAIQAQLVSLSAMGIKRGVYFKSEDLLKNQPTETPQDCSKNECFQMEETFGYQTLKIKTEQNNTFIYPAGTIYAFVDCYGRVFRYFNDKYYQVLEIGQVNLYALVRKEFVGGYVIPETEYYFSTSLESEIMPLERENFLAAYAHLPEFHSYVDRNFYPNISLKQFNKQNGTYEISQVYSNLVGMMSLKSEE